MKIQYYWNCDKFCYSSSLCSRLIIHHAAAITGMVVATINKLTPWSNKSEKQKLIDNL